MNKPNGIDFIYHYAATDIALSSATRIYTLYCTWYFIQIEHASNKLSSMLTIIWLANTISLLTSNIISQKFGYTRTIKAISIIALSSMTSIFIVTHYKTIGLTTQNDMAIFALIGALLSMASTMLTPLSIPLISISSKDQNSINKRIKIMSNMFILNLIFGTFVGGLIINYYGGPYALILGIAIASNGVISSIIFGKIFKSYEKDRTKNLSASPLAQIYNGIRLVLRTPSERAVAAASMIINAIITPVIFLVFPIIILNNGGTIIDVSIAELFVGIGLLSSSYFLFDLVSRFASPHLIVSLSPLIFSASLALATIPKPTYYIFISSYMIGIGLSLFNVTVNTKRTLSIPKKLLPIMESSLLFFCTISIPLGFRATKVLMHGNSHNKLIIELIIILLISFFILFLSKPLKNMLNDKHGDVKTYYERTHPNHFTGE